MPDAIVEIIQEANLKKLLDELEAGSYLTMSDDELRGAVQKINAGFTLTAPTYPAGTTIYRAVRVAERPLLAQDVGYAPPEKVSLGRLNHPGKPMFYGTLNRFAAPLLESSCVAGDTFAISCWVTLERMTFNHLGYSTAVLDRFKTTRELPFFAGKDRDSDRNKLIREWQSRVFTQDVPRDRPELYRLPVALSDAALGKMNQIDPKMPTLFSGIIYPSIATWGLEDNVAILPSEVDAKLALFEVIYLGVPAIPVDRKADGSVVTSYVLNPMDFARRDDAANLIWGQRSQVVYPDGVDHSQIEVKVLPPA